MTGYGRQSVEVDQLKWTVEIRSLNHRFLDFSPKIPRSFLFMEDTIKGKVSQHIKRGHVDLFIHVESGDIHNQQLHVDYDLVSQYIEKLQSLKDKHKLTGDITIDMVTKLENVFSVSEKNEQESQLESSILLAIEDALSSLVFMREKEGERLADDLRYRLVSLKNIIEGMESRREHVVAEYRHKILTRIQSYIDDQIQVEDHRVLQEVALLAEKGDITEEITRLQSHIDQFQMTLKKDGPIGRTLDFIVQEFHREINTIGSKSNDQLLSNDVVKMKSEIEKMKEQIQNIE